MSKGVLPVKMQHVALVCSSEKNADQFYMELLGLEKSVPKILSTELVRAIFNIKSEMTVINYIGEKVRFEIFIADPGNARDAIPLPHVCLEVKAIDSLVEKCRTMGFEVILAPKGDRILTFILDHDRNLFEIKATP
jgi:catechol 2,3-dioxygenase-like lactoylglutathione lyase family enzyme